MSYFEKRYEYFTDREGRAAFIANTFQKELADSHNVLDVGCDINSLKKIIGDKVTGVDLYGTPDLKIDFEKEKLTRFQNGEFDFVVCTEVLEHLENLYEMTDELFRVSGKYIVVSLPNCFDMFTKWKLLFHDYAGKFYGLPVEKPEDRHRWFFGYRDIDRFFVYQSTKKHFSIEKKFLHCNYSNSLKGRLMRLFVNITGLNAGAQSYWILLRKQ